MYAYNTHSKRDIHSLRRKGIYMKYALIILKQILIDFYFLYFRVVSLSKSPVDESLISGSLDKSVRIWDLRSHNCQVMYLMLFKNFSKIF